MGDAALPASPAGTVGGRLTPMCCELSLSIAAAMRADCGFACKWNGDACRQNLHCHVVSPATGKPVRFLGACCSFADRKPRY